jgi:hypothetical protein
MTTYYKVDSGLASEIRKMREEMEAIPHYEGKYIELGDLTKQSKCELMRKMKYNLMEADKQYKNEDSKGWIGTCYYTLRANQREHVEPAFKYLFNMDKMDRFINHLISIRLNDYFDKYIKKDWIERRHFPIHHYIHFIEDVWQKVFWTITECEDITSMNLTISFNVEDIAKTRKKYFNENDGEISVLIPDSVNFFNGYEGKEKSKYYLKSCSNCSGNNEYLESLEDAKQWWEKEDLSNKMYKLSEWEKGFIETFKVTEEELKELYRHNSKYKN